MFKRLFLSLSAFFLCSCQTIHYVNSGEEGGFAQGGLYEISKWHHIGVLGLVEYSSPVNVPALCGEGAGWKAVRTQTNIAQGAVKGVAPAILNHVISGLGSIFQFAYTPEEVSVSCGS